MKRGFKQNPIGSKERGERLSTLKNFFIKEDEDPTEEAEEYSLAIRRDTRQMFIMIDGIWTPMGGGMTLIDHGTVESASSKTISGLHGDTDKLYKLIIRAKFSGAEADFYLQPNADTGTEYLWSIKKTGRVGGADVDANVNPGGSLQTDFRMWDGSFFQGFTEVLINAESGKERLFLAKTTTYTSSSNYTMQSVAGIWTDTADEITSLRFSAGSNFITGSEYWLYKLTQ